MEGAPLKTPTRKGFLPSCFGIICEASFGYNQETERMGKASHLYIYNVLENEKASNIFLFYMDSIDWT